MREISFSLISLICYGYILIAAAISYFLPLTDATKSLIAQPALILIPYLVGKPLLHLVRRFLSLKGSNDLAIEILLGWSLGLIFMVTLEVVLYLNYAFSLNSFTIILLIIALPSIFIKERADFSNLKRIDIAIVAIYGFLFSLFVTYFWPYPHANDNDYITHTFYVLKIVTQNRPLVFYGDYLPTMHTIYAVMMKLFSIDPYGEPLYVLWASRFILYPVYTIGLYLFTLQFSKSKPLAVITALVGSSLASTVNGALFPYHTAPKNYIDLLIIYGLFASLKLRDEGGEQKLVPHLFGLGALLFAVFFPLYFTGTGSIIGYEIGFILPILLVLILILPRLTSLRQRNFFLSLSIVLAILVFMAKMQGFTAGAMILAFLFLSWGLKRLTLKGARLITAVSVLVTLAVFLLFHFKVVPYPKLPFLRPNDVEIGLFGMDTLVKYFNSYYPFILVFLFIAGSLFVLLSQAERESGFLPAVLLVSLILLAYFSPVYMSFRFLGDAHPFIILLAVFGIFSILRIHHANLREAGVILPLLLVVLSVGITVYTSDVKTFRTADSYLYKKDQLQVFPVGEYIKDNVDKGAIIIQSHFYQQLAAFYGGVDTTFLWKAGRYEDSYVRDIYSAQTSEEAYKKARELLKIQEQVVRYADKDGREIKRFYREPTDTILLGDDYTFEATGADAAKFMDPIYFEILYITKNSEKRNFYVTRVKPEPLTASYPNLVKNPSFEEGSDSSNPGVSWRQVWDNRWSGSLDSSVRYSGNYSYRMETSVTQPYSWSALRSDDIPVTGGKAYLFSGRIKTENAQSSYVEVSYYDKASEKLKTIGVLGPAEKTKDWKVYSKRIEIPEGVGSITIFAAAGWVQEEARGKGVTWFEDFRLIGPVEVKALKP